MIRFPKIISKNFQIGKQISSTTRYGCWYHGNLRVPTQCHSVQQIKILTIGDYYYKLLDIYIFLWVGSFWRFAVVFFLLLRIFPNLNQLQQRQNCCRWTVRMCFHQLSLIDTFSSLTATEVAVMTWLGTSLHRWVVGDIFYHP